LDNAAAALTVVGAAVHRGVLGDLESLHASAAADCIIYLTFANISATACTADLRVMEMIGAALEG